MLEQGKISGRQFGILLGLYTIGNSTIYMPAPLTAVAKQDAWIAVLLGVLGAIPLILLYITLGRKFPDQNLAQYSERILGRFFGKLAALAVFFYVYVGMLFAVWGVSDFMATRMLSRTPIEIIISLTVITVVYCVILGLETIARVGEILFPLTLLALLFLFLMLIPNMKPSNFLPILEKGLKPPIQGGLQIFVYPMMGISNFLMMLPYVNKASSAKKAYFVGTLIGGVVLWSVTIVNIAVLGVTLVSDSIYPTYDLAQKINIGDFLQRVEAIAIFMWSVTNHLYTVINFYFMVLILAQILDLQEYRSLVLPLGLITIPLANVLVPNTPYSYIAFNQIFPPFSISVTILLPLLMLFVSRLRHKSVSIEKPET